MRAAMRVSDSNIPLLHADAADTHPSSSSSSATTAAASSAAVTPSVSSHAHATPHPAPPSRSTDGRSATNQADLLAAAGGGSRGGSSVPPSSHGAHHVRMLSPRTPPPATSPRSPPVFSVDGTSGEQGDRGEIQGGGDGRHAEVGGAPQLAPHLARRPPALDPRGPFGMPSAVAFEAPSPSPVPTAGNRGGRQVPYGHVSITVSHVLGPKKVLDAHIFPLQEPSAASAHGAKGSPLYCRGSHEEGSRVRLLPKELREDVYYIQGDCNDMFHSGKHAFITGSANCCIRLYVLFPSTMKPPKWLVTDFIKARESTVVVVSWKASRAQGFLLKMAQTWNAAESQVLKVWSSKKVYKANEPFTLNGADATGDLTDMPYVFAFRVAKTPQSLDQSVFSSLRDMTAAERVSALVKRNDMASIAAYLRDGHAGAVRHELPTGVLDCEAVLHLALKVSNVDVVRALLLECPAALPLFKRTDIAKRVASVATVQVDPALLMLLFSPDRLHLELRVSALEFLVHQWAQCSIIREQHEVGDYRAPLEVERYLVTYIIKHRNPLSTTAAILQAIRKEQLSVDDTRRFMKLMFSKFKSLHLAILTRLESYTQIKNIREMDKILAPMVQPRTINEVSCLQAAFEMTDLAFMASSIMVDYTSTNWRGIDFCILTRRDDPRSMSMLSPLIGYRIMRNLGLAGGLADPLLKVTMRLWHTYALASASFFHSPRGRWAFALMSETALVALYQVSVIYPRAKSITNVHWALLVFLLGNLLEVLQYVRLRYGSWSRLHKYVDDPWNALNLFTSGALMIACSLKLAEDYGVPNLPPPGQTNAIHIIMASLAVFVWLRTLGYLIPVYPTLGPLLNTMASMVEEVLAFMAPMGIILTGFATMLAGVLWMQLGSYGSFHSALYTLFQAMLGQFNISEFSQANGLTAAQALWAKIMLAIFMVLSTVLLLNLLIAIIQRRYQPEEVEAEAQYRRAQVVDQYAVQVKYDLIGSPFNLLQLAFFWLPRIKRKKLNTSSAMSLLMLPPLDGYVLPDGQSLVWAGESEFPHLIFLLTLYPVIAITTNLLFLFYAPFGMAFFASRGWLKWRRSHKRSRALARAEALRHVPGTVVDGTVGPTAPPTTAADAATRQSREISGGSAAVPHADDDDQTLLHPATYNVKPEQLEGLEAMPATKGQRGSNLFWSTLLTIPLNILFWIVGFAVYLLFWTLIFFLWTTVYVWVAKLAFSLWNLLGRGLWALVMRGADATWKGAGATWQAGKTWRSDHVGGVRASSGSEGGREALTPPRERRLSMDQGGRKSVDGVSRRSVDGGLRRSMDGAPGGLISEVSLGEADAAAAAEAAEDDGATQGAKDFKSAQRKRRKGCIKRYLSENEVLKAVGQSKFVRQMEKWGLEAQPLTRLDEEDEQIRALQPSVGQVNAQPDEGKENDQDELLSNVQSAQAATAAANEAVNKRMRDLVAKVESLHSVLKDADQHHSMEGPTGRWSGAGASDRPSARHTSGSGSATGHAATTSGDRTSGARAHPHAVASAHKQANGHSHAAAHPANATAAAAVAAHHAPPPTEHLLPPAGPSAASSGHHSAANGGLGASPYSPPVARSLLGLAAAAPRPTSANSARPGAVAAPQPGRPATSESARHSHTPTPTSGRPATADSAHQSPASPPGRPTASDSAHQSPAVAATADRGGPAVTTPVWI